MMLLVRKIDKDNSGNSKLYQLFKFFINSCLVEIKENLAADYINALIRNDIISIAKIVLSYKPIEKYDTPDYDKVAATLISA